MTQFKYLFKALLSDGTVIEQNQSDQGSVPGKNCFYDVLQAQDKLRAFALYNQTTGDEWVIDLHTCEFEHNVPVFDKYTSLTHYVGSKFKLHGDLTLENIRLIWFFEREMVLNIVQSTVQTNQILNYNFGFQCNVKSTGENKKFIITLT